MPTHARRERRAAPARQAAASCSSSRLLGFERGHARGLPASAARAAATASCWSPARPAAARRRRSTPRCCASTRRTRKILTVEDPIEYQLDGVNQIQVKPQIGLTFANGLRSILRQDPDVIMVGEIRDLRDGGDRRPGGADRPPGAVDPAHQRAAGDASPACSTWGSRTTCSPRRSTAMLAQRLVRRLCRAVPASRYAPRAELIERARPGAAGGRASRSGSTAAGRLRACDGTGYHGRVGDRRAAGDRRADAQPADSCAGATAQIQRAAVDAGMRTHATRTACARSWPA